MIAEKIQQLEAELGHCSCGGRLYINRYSKGRKRKEKVLHFVVKCEACGAWHGGLTTKSKRIYFKKEAQS